MNPKITIIIPTTTDRGLLLPLAVDSILNQTVQEFEIFIIGDGMTENSRSVILELVAKDARIRFFDHPKHSRRGEEYRHEALRTCRSEYVTYMCDRDLLLPNHFQNLLNSFKKGNFISVTPYMAKGNEIFYNVISMSYFMKRGGVLSAVGHTLALYRKLPYGWRTTPEDFPTDVYMWQQFLSHTDCEPFYALEASLLYFKRGDHPGLPTSERYKELKYWVEIIKNPAILQNYEEDAHRKLFLEYVKIRTSWFSIKGRNIGELPDAIMNRIGLIFQKILK